MPIVPCLMPAGLILRAARSMYPFEHNSQERSTQVRPGTTPGELPLQGSCRALREDLSIVSGY